MFIYLLDTRSVSVPAGKIILQCLRDRERDRERETETERQRDRETETERENRILTLPRTEKTISLGSVLLLTLFPSQ